MSHINKIGTATAPHKMNQLEVGQFMQHFYNIDENSKRKIGLMYDRSGITTRYSAVPDYNLNTSIKHLLPQNINGPFPFIDKRMDLFFEIAPQMAKEAILNCLENNNELKTITHFITVSCTGMAAPGLDLILMEQLNIPSHVHRTSVNFMGCYAVFHALKMADAFCNANKNNKVLIVSVELCTLHFQSNFSMDNVAANLLFADGAAACVVSHSANYNNAIQLNSFYSQVLFNGKKDMAWHISPTGFLMTLSAFIPTLIETGIVNLLTQALQNANIKSTEIKNWAIHPGGRKIVETIQKQLALTDAEVAVSFQILKNYGNMSSATILFVLQQMQLSNQKGKVFACGFGPGITLETLIGEFV